MVDNQDNIQDNSQPILRHSYYGHYLQTPMNNSSVYNPDPHWDSPLIFSPSYCIASSNQLNSWTQFLCYKNIMNN